MDIEIVCKPSAFKHGVTENDICWVFNTAKYDHLVEGFKNKYLLIGFDVHGNLLEVMYNDLGGNRVNVFHTKHLPKTDPTKGGVTTRQGFRMVALDKLSEDYILTMALASRKNPTEIISEMVRDKIAVAL